MQLQLESEEFVFELSGLSRELAEQVITSAAKKLPIKARFVAKGEIK